MLFLTLLKSEDFTPWPLAACMRRLNKEAREGDTVSIAPCRPLSRRKSYKLVSVLEKAGAQ